MKMSLRNQSGNNDWKMRKEMKMVSLRSLLYKLCGFTALPLGWSQRWKCNSVEGNMPLSS